MFIFLAFLGALITVSGVVAQSVHEAEIAETEAEAEREKIPALQAQLTAQKADLADIEADKAAAAQMAIIEQGTLTTKGLQTTYAGSAAKGNVVAGAAAGNLGGASTLRQTQLIQRQLQWQMSAIGGERQAAGLRAENAQRDLETRSLATEAQILETQYDIRWAGRRAEQQEDEAEYLRSMGLLTGGGGLLGAIGSAFGL